jgi:hypothetical protein
MSGIPAASVSKSDLERIRAAVPGAETEAERIGQLLLKGEETEADLLRLVQLLYTAGETPRAELMLVANSRGGDQLHALHRELFGKVEREYEGALTALSDQLCVLLAPVRTSRLYSRVFRCSSASNDNKPTHWIWNHFRTPFEAQVTYEPGMGSRRTRTATRPFIARGPCGSWPVPPPRMASRPTGHPPWTP